MNVVDRSKTQRIEFTDVLRIAVAQIAFVHTGRTETFDIGRTVVRQLKRIGGAEKRLIRFDSSAAQRKLGIKCEGKARSRIWMNAQCGEFRADTQRRVRRGGRRLADGQRLGVTGRRRGRLIL